MARPSRNGHVVKINVVAVLAARNEEETIYDVVIGLRQFADHVVVSDDASEDDTAEEAMRAGAVVHTRPYHVGYDKCVDDGFSIAMNHGAEIIFTWDSGGRFHPEDIPYLLNPIAHDDADVVIGKRGRGATTNWGELVFAAYTKRYGISDPLCPVKAFNSIVYRKIGYYDEIGGMGTHLMMEAARRNYRIAEVSIGTRPGPKPEPERVDNIAIVETLYRVIRV